MVEQLHSLAEELYYINASISVLIAQKKNMDQETLMTLNKRLGTIIKKIREINHEI